MISNTLHHTPTTLVCGETCAVSVADADVITALIVVGILEPAESAGAGAAAGDGGAAALGIFKPQDTAALRAVAVQVRSIRFVVINILKPVTPPAQRPIFLPPLPPIRYCFITS